METQVLTQQAMQSMISQFGVVTNAANINGKNAASVIVTAELTTFCKARAEAGYCCINCRSSEVIAWGYATDDAVAGRGW